MSKGVVGSTSAFMELAMLPCYSAVVNLGVNVYTLVGSQNLRVGGTRRHNLHWVLLRDFLGPRYLIEVIRLLRRDAQP
jgi:hypothetical protein